MKHLLLALSLLFATQIFAHELDNYVGLYSLNRMDAEGELSCPRLLEIERNLQATELYLVDYSANEEFITFEDIIPEYEAERISALSKSFYNNVELVSITKQFKGFSYFSEKIRLQRVDTVVAGMTFSYKSNKGNKLTCDYFKIGTR